MLYFQEADSNDLSGGAIAGITIVTLVILAAGAVFVIYFIKKGKFLHCPEKIFKFHNSIIKFRGQRIKKLQSERKLRLTNREINFKCQHRIQDVYRK